MTSAVKAAILGPGNIGTDLMMKLLRTPGVSLELISGIYADSPGLERARQHGVGTSDRGLTAVLERDDVELVFDATSAGAHTESGPRLVAAGKRVVDLTPAALGPYVVPTVNQDEHIDAPNVNLVSCGGQATIPFVHAISRVSAVEYAEIIATISSASAGPGTRQNIDEFTRTTARGLEMVGGAHRAKAIIILNPADPPIMMRDTIYARVADLSAFAEIRKSVLAMVSNIQHDVPGLRLTRCEADTDHVTVMIELEGAGDFLPRYAGNLDVMTAAAAAVGRRIAQRIADGRQ